MKDCIILFLDIDIGHLPAFSEWSIGGFLICGILH